MGSQWSNPTDGKHLLTMIAEDAAFEDYFICKAQLLLHTVIQRFHTNEGLCRIIDAQPEWHMAEYAKFFALKVVCDDTDSKFLSPTPKVDKIWHEHILSNLDWYIKDCEFLLVVSNCEYWQTQPKCIYISHRRIDNQEEAKLMLATYKQIEAIVWPAALVTMKRNSMNEGTMSDDDSEEEGTTCA
jgi:hypothetical protein